MTPEKSSEINDIQRLKVKKVPANTNKPKDVSPDVYEFRTVFPCHASLSCGNMTKPNKRLTIEITMSCQTIIPPRNTEVK